MTHQSLPAAKAHLEKALGQLFDPIQATINGKTYESPGYYQQLDEAVFGMTGERCGGIAGMPMWPEAFDIRNEIDHQLHLWCNGKGTDTFVRAYLIGVRAWRPQDVEAIGEIVTQMEAWLIKIEEILNPQWRKELPNPCPECKERYSFRHSAGERVRSAALQIDHTGCRCQNCRTHWTPDQFGLLGRVLGYKPDDTVGDTSA
jgi:hypothetical protein